MYSAALQMELAKFPCHHRGFSGRGCCFWRRSLCGGQASLPAVEPGFQPGGSAHVAGGLWNN